MIYIFGNTKILIEESSMDKCIKKKLTRKYKIISFRNFLSFSNNEFFNKQSEAENVDNKISRELDEYLFTTTRYY